MKYIIIFFYFIILPIFSLKEIKTKFCINCKYFVKDNDNNKFGKCSLFPSQQGKIDFLVNDINKGEYKFCSTARLFDSLCGEEGKMYKKKYIKNNNLK